MSVVGWSCYHHQNVASGRQQQNFLKCAYGNYNHQISTTKPLRSEDTDEMFKFSLMVFGTADCSAWYVELDVLDWCWVCVCLGCVCEMSLDATTGARAFTLWGWTKTLLLDILKLLHFLSLLLHWLVDCWRLKDCLQWLLYWLQWLLKCTKGWQDLWHICAQG